MGNDLTSPRITKIFEQLDHGGDGVLTLDELVTVGKLPGVQCPFTHSPLLLFRFDNGEDGALDKEEFEKWLRHLLSFKKKAKEKKRERKKREKQMEKKHRREEQKRHKGSKKTANGSDGSQEQLSLTGSSGGVTRDSSAAWTTIDKKSAKDKIDLTRNSETPAILGQQQGGQSDSEPGSLNSSTDSKKAKDWPKEGEGEEDQVSEELQHFLSNLLLRSERRKRYVSWLFHLADVDNDGDLDAAELGLLLKTLEKDGIDIEKLSYEKCDTTKIAQKLIDEYNPSKTGFLTHDEFLVLGDLIMKHYEENHQQTQSNQKEMGKIGQYLLKRKLGVGASGVVRLGINTETGERKAIKIIKRGDVSEMSRLDTEVKALLMLDHPNVVALDEVLENEEFIFFVMEVCGGGTLSNYVDIKPLAEPLARYYMPQLLQGLQYCHKMGVCHRDLKLENLLLDIEGMLNISDFGHAGIYRKGWDLFSTGLVGSLYHVTPEQVEGQCYSGEKIDMWAVGVILYRLLVGRPPFFSEIPQEMLTMIREVSYTTPASMSPEAKDLISKLLNKDPEARPVCSKVLKHPWFNGPVKKKKLAEYVMKLGGRRGASLSSAELEEIWTKGICDSVKELNLHIIQAEPTKRHHKFMIKCIYPKKELKFSITLKMQKRGVVWGGGTGRKGRETNVAEKSERKESQSSSVPEKTSSKKEKELIPFVEFNLREGESWEFNDLVYKIRTAFRRWKRKKKAMRKNKA